MTAATALLGTAAPTLAADTPAPAKPDPGKAAKIASEVCTACHAADGNSTTAAIPRLAGQHYEYLFKQLQNFKATNGKPAERVNSIMSGFVAPLSEDDMRNLAAFYSTQTLKPSFARNKDSVDLGRQIFHGGIASKSVPACAACHSANGAGLPAQYPRLAGQNTDYAVEQLTLFRSGGRRNSQPMMDIAARLSDVEIKAVADYMAGLR